MIRGANPSKEGEGVAIAAKQDVLTVVDALARRGIGERRRPTTQRRARFEDENAPPVLRKGSGRAESGKAATNHDRVGVHVRNIARAHSRSAITAR